MSLRLNKSTPTFQTKKKHQVLQEEQDQSVINDQETDQSTTC